MNEERTNFTWQPALNRQVGLLPNLNLLSKLWQIWAGRHQTWTERMRPLLSSNSRVDLLCKLTGHCSGIEDMCPSVSYTMLCVLLDPPCNVSAFCVTGDLDAGGVQWV